MRKLFTFCLALVASAGIALGAVPEDHFRFVSNQDGSSVGLAQIASHQTLEFSTDGNIWSNMTTETTISLNDGVSLYVRGKLTDNNSTSDYTQFAITGKVKAQGNINYLWDYENPDADLKERCGYELFGNCAGLITAPIMPANVLSAGCYEKMYHDCTSLTAAPTLNATTLAAACYRDMFVRCSSITSVQSTLPATTLTEACYWSMFHTCSSLTKAPTLPATELTYGCYAYMFKNCTSLTSTPALPAKKLAEKCYTQMFWGCKKVNYIKCLATNISATSCTENWVKGVASSGTFVSHKSMSSWTTGVNGKPSGWSTSTVTPYTISFDANGGIIPTEGNMGSAIDKQVTSLSSDQKTGFVIVTSGQTTFSKMRNDCPTRAGHMFLGWYTAKTGGTQVYDELGVYVSGSYWDADGKWKGTSDLQLYAYWEAQICTITWQQDDGTLIDKTIVPYGQIPTHISPTKEANAEFTYTFAGWSPEVVAAEGDASYTATYTTTRKSYTITWLQDDGALIDKTTVEYGQMPTHADPTKEPTDEFTYTFVKWAPNLVAVTDNATYMAVYESHSRTEGIEDVNADTQAIKVIREGQLFIIRNGKTYDAQGQEVQ